MQLAPPPSGRPRRASGGRETLAPAHLPVEGIEHLNDDKGGEGHGGRVEVGKYLTLHALESLILYKTLRLMCLHQPSQTQYT